MLFLSFPSFLFISFLLHYRQLLFLFDIKIPFCPSNSSHSKETVEDCFGVFVFSFLPFSSTLLYNFLYFIPPNPFLISQPLHTDGERKRKRRSGSQPLHTHGERKRKRRSGSLGKYSSKIKLIYFFIVFVYVLDDFLRGFRMDF
jgi:hypothetical protein